MQKKKFLPCYFLDKNFYPMIDTEILLNIKSVKRIHYNKELNSVVLIDFDNIMYSLKIELTEEQFYFLANDLTAFETTFAEKIIPADSSKLNDRKPEGENL